MTDPARSSPTPVRVLFVCLGNICRSPLAEGIFVHLVREASLDDRFEVDSAGTGGWHVGEPADARSIAVAERYGIRLVGASRRVREEDFDAFDWILAMDGDNLAALEHIGPKSEARARVALIRDFDPQAGHDRAVPDPYYGGPEGFDDVFELLHRSCEAFLESLPGEGID